MGEKTDEKELLISKCDSIIHAKSTDSGITDDPAITVSPNSNTTSHAKSTNDGVISNGFPSTENSVINQNTESKFEISKYDTQKERDDFFIKTIV